MEELVHYGEGLKRLALRLVHDEGVAEDAVQQAYVVALEHPPRSHAALGPWLQRVLRSRIVDLGRRKARERPLASHEPSDPNDFPRRLEVQEELSRAVESLAQPYRQVVVLRYYEDGSPTEIAARLGVPVKTVKARLSRALEMLRVRLDERYASRRSWAVLLAPIAASRASRELPTRETSSGISLLSAAKLVILAIGSALGASIAYVHFRPLEPSVAVPTQSSLTRPPVSEPDTARPPDDRAGVSVRRETVPTDALRGRVIAENGKPIANATISWTSLQEEDLEWEPAWQEDDWGLLVRSTVWTTSDAEGRYVFSDAPGNFASGSVIWATHPDFEAGCLLLDRGLDPAVSQGAIWLRASAPFLVRVEDARGGPVEAAEVAQYGLTPRFALPEGNGGLNEERARRHLIRTSQTGSDGRAGLPVFPGEQVILAKKDSHSSLPWRGQYREEVVLRILDGFTVGGRVFLPDWSHLNYVGERRIMIAAQRGSLWYGLASLRSVQAGPWGPLSIPLLEGARYRIRLEGSPIVPAVVDFAVPEPGASLAFDLEAQLGHNLWALGIDEQEEPIRNSEAVVSWTREGRANSIRRRAQPDGYINLWSIPEATVLVTISAPGFVPGVSDYLPIPLREDGTVALKLRRGGVLSGRCLHEGKPVEDFEVVVWQEGLEEDKQLRTFRARQDGSFEFEGVPLGQVLVTAASGSLIGRETRSVSIEGEAEVILELLEPKAGRGFVVDANSEQPIPTAEVQVNLMGIRNPVGPWGAPEQVAADGSFEIEGFAIGGNVIQVRAPGYSEKAVRAFVAADQDVDFGRIALSRPQPLEIQLVAGDGRSTVDFTGYEAFSADEPPLPHTAFSALGIVRFEEVAAGTRSFIIQKPGRPWAGLALRLQPGESWRFTHRIGGPRTLTIEVLAEAGRSLEDTPAMLLAYQDSRGIQTEWGISIPLDGVATVDGIDAESVNVDVLDRDWLTVATTQASFDGRDEMHVSVHLGGKPFLVRVLGSDGTPIAGVQVKVNDSLPSSLFLLGTTSDWGECQLYGVPQRSVFVHLSHQSRGTRYGIPCDGTAGEVELVLENDASIELLLLDRDVPLDDVTCSFLNTSGTQITQGRNSDPAGRVSWQGLTAGPYRISLRRADVWPLDVDSEARKEDRLQSVQLRRMANIAFDLRSKEGLPVSGQAIGLLSEEFGADVSEWLGEERVQSAGGLVSDRKGHIQVDGLPHGTYRWQLTTATGAVLAGELEVLPGETSVQPIFLQ